MLSVRRKWRWRTPLFLVFLLATGGCSFTEGTLTALATHNVNVPAQPLARGVEGRDCIYFLLGIPVSGSLIPNLQEAEDRAIAQSPEGNAMQDLALYMDQTWYVVVTQTCYRVRGDVVRIAQQAPSAVQSGPGGTPMKKAVLFLAIAMLSSGCTTRIGAFTFASTKNLGVAYAPLQTSVEGEDCVNMILFIPIGTLNPNLADAVDRAVEKVPNGDMMTNVTVNEDILITLIYNRICARVNGDVVNSRASGTTQRQGTSLVPGNATVAPNPNLGDQWKSGNPE